jgi:O-antigen/teichoic acid export membrane protein
MCISAAVFAVSAFFDMGYQCAKDTKRTLPAIFLSAIINVILNFILTPLIGVTGIIITANITYLVLVVYRWYDMKRYLKLQIFKKTFIPILTSLVGLAMFYVMNAWWQDIVFMIAAIMVVIYTAPQFIP